MGKTINVLIVEDCEDDALMLINELRSGGYDPIFERVETPAALRAALRQDYWQLVICDYLMPHLSPSEALQILRETRLDLPFIVVSGAIGDEKAVEMLKEGADDYVLKDRLSRLLPAIEHELHAREARRQRRQAEEALQKSEARFHSLFENMLNGFAYCRMLFEQDWPVDFIYLDVNAAFETLTGLKGVTGKRVTEVIPGIREADPGLFEIYGRVARTGVPEKFETYVEALKMWFAISVYCPSEDHFVAVFDVITERKQAEQALQESERNLREAQTVAGLGQYVYNIVNDSWTSSEVLDRVFGIGEAYDRSAKGWLAIVHPDHRQVMHDYLMQEVVGAGKSFDREYKIISLDNGREKWVHGLGRLEFDGCGRPVRMIGTIQDITGRKQAEVALRESEKNFRSIFENTAEAFYRTDAAGNVIMVNPAGARLLGFEKPADVIGRPTLSFVADPDEAHRILARLPEEGSLNDVEIKMRRRDGSLVDVSGSVHFYYDEAGQVLGREGFIRDITAHKQAEEAVQQSRNFLDKIINSISDPIFVKDREHRLVLANDAECELAGRAREEILGKTDYDFFPAEQVDVFWAKDEEVLNIGHENINEEEITDARGNRRLISTKKTRYTDESGNQFIVGIIRDITEHRLAEEEIHSLAKFPEENPSPVLRLLQDGRILYVNPAGQALLRDWDDQQHGRFSGYWKRTFEAIPAGQYLIQVEVPIGDRIFSFEVLPVFNTEYVNIYGRDISTLKRIQKELEDSLKEKEMLLKEIHHRVKNNLQIISSLLNLQAGYLDGGTALTAFKESQNRIRSMALIHERLYQAGDFAQIDFGAYVRSLTSYLFHSYRTDASRIFLEMDVEDARLGLDASVPCGLIINELVSNALKHAFPEERKGRVTVSFRRQNGHHLLAVQDDGIGLPEGFCLEQSDSLGLQLVNSLTGQLQGKMQIERNEGTAFKVTF